MPGRYDITEKVGQLEVVNVSRFILKGSQINLTMIHCQKNATFGFTFANIDDIVVSDIQISHCCAQLTANFTIDATQVDNYTMHETVKSEIDASNRQWLNAYQGSCNAQNRFPCCTTIATIDNGKISIYQTTVLHSRGVGILILRYASLNISDSILAYSSINCIIYISNNLENTMTTVSNNRMLIGREHSFNLASGLNIISVSISLISIRFDSINVNNNTFTSNSASKGNFYLLVYRGMECHNLASVKITIANNAIKTTVATSGITIEYIILDSLPLPLLLKQRYYDWLWPQCIQPHTSEKEIPVTYIIQNNYLEGSCVVVKDLLKRGNKYLNIILTGVTINKSQCPVALKLEHIDSFYSKPVEGSMYNGHVKKITNVEHCQIYIQDLAISLSRNNIMLFTAQDEAHPVLFLGNISFTENQGSIIVVSAKLTLQGDVQISNNHVHDHESVFLIRDTSEISFQGDITFINNRGREGGALSIYSSDIKFQGDIIFINNTGRQGGALSAYSSDIKFQGDVTFMNNSGWQGGALSVYSSNTEFQGRIRFIGNIAETAGGGISLREGSTIFLETITDLSFCTNTAFEYGGGVFVEETMLWESNMTLKCFIQTFKVNSTIVFENNKAELAGMALFGGWIDVCNPENHAVRPIYTFKNHGQHYMDEYSDISSNAARVCICKHSRPMCNITSVSIETIPGKTFTVEAVAVGQRFGVVSAVVKAEFQNRHRI